MIAGLSVLYLAGCAAPGTCAQADLCADDPAETEDGSAMVYSSDEPEPLWNLEEFGEAVEAFSAIATPNGRDILSAWTIMMANGDDTCPGDSYRLSTVPEGCDTETGYHFAGIGWYYASAWLSAEGVPSWEDGTSQPTDEGAVLLDFSHGGDFEILTPDLHRFAGGGGLTYFTDYKTPNDISFETEMHGSWVDQTRTDWLGEGYSGVWEATGWFDGYTDYSFAISGGISVGEYDAYLENVSWDTTGECGGAMVGKLYLRDERGFWTTWDLGDDCDTCGPVTFHDDVDLGDLCLDMTDYGRTLLALNVPR